MSRKVTRLLGSADQNQEPDYTLGLRNVVKKERELLQCDDIITNLALISSQLEGAQLAYVEAYRVSQMALEIIDSPLTKADFEREGKLSELRRQAGIVLHAIYKVDSYLVSTV